MVILGSTMVVVLVNVASLSIQVGVLVNPAFGAGKIITSFVIEIGQPSEVVTVNVTLCFPEFWNACATTLEFVLSTFPFPKSHSIFVMVLPAGALELSVKVIMLRSQLPEKV